MHTQVEQPSRPSRPKWATILSVLTVLVAIGTVALHVVGITSHRTYMQYWGIDAGVFPKTADLILIDGYYGVINQSALAFLRILSNPGAWTAGACFLALYLFVLVSPWDAGTGRASEWLAQRKPGVRRMVKCLIATLLLAAVIPCMLIAWTLVMYFPDAIGAANGKQSAEAEAVEFAKGCTKSKYQCVQLRKGSELLGSGFLLDGSPAFVAIFDAERQRARVLPREGVELITGRPPVLPEAHRP
ncbi:hypothetical protein [Variovorax sp. LG9.2]|jgi:hypothetical protein|uniref:hypothetical protein n=1 Tax=Variovorax sp. LG9.2 TaxID=3048626 RepID=UPI002B22996E|nr:hypothetical protein [Variovorax sp. LG9.2]MEB0060101.1 hypothetical protein [Variovorax sp. LG9.2]